MLTEATQFVSGAPLDHAAGRVSGPCVASDEIGGVRSSLAESGLDLVLDMVLLNKNMSGAAWDTSQCSRHGAS